MFVALDVDYRDDLARTGWVLFSGWEAGQPLREGTFLTSPVASYEPGAFYKRELPCLLQALKALPPVGLVILDAYCWLGPERPGLGARLYEALDQRCPVVGVAKTAFQGQPGTPVTRGASLTPLYVTACGLEEIEAADRVKSMHGAFRIPTLLKRVDQLARGLVLPQ